MPSRRRFLLAGATTVGGLAGCATLDGAAGYVQYKGIVGARRDSGRTRRESVLRVTLGDPAAPAPANVDHLSDRWADRFRSPAAPTVSDGLHGELLAEYDDVTYLVGVCSPSWRDGSHGRGCVNAPASRDDFNRVQIYDRVRASLRDDRLAVLSVG